MTLELDERDNIHGFLAVLQGILWITFAVGISTAVSSWLYPISALLIGAQQWIFANLLREAASGKLFRSRLLNETIGRITFGWPIFQTFSDHKDPLGRNRGAIVEDTDNPRLRYMIAGNTRDNVTCQETPTMQPVLLLDYGLKLINYIYGISYKRALQLLQRANRIETFLMFLFHIFVGLIAYYLVGLEYIIIFWWLPYFFIYPIVNWFGQMITIFLQWTPF